MFRLDRPVQKCSIVVYGVYATWMDIVKNLLIWSSRRIFPRESRMGLEHT
jgi:hypothetical protein